MANLALQVAHQLMSIDALGAHARDELGMSAHTTAKPIQAALASELTFAAGAVLPWWLQPWHRTCRSPAS